MSREVEPREMIEETPLVKFYKFVSKELPGGLLGEENGYDVKVNNSDLRAIIFEMDGSNVSFGLFTEGGRYARKTLLIDEQGQVTEDTRGVIPDFDLKESEPDFSTLSNEEIATSVVEQILNYRRPQVH